MNSEFILQVNEGLAGVVSKVYPALVQVSNGRMGHGAGTIWHRSGLVMTNSHVVGRRAPKVILADGREFRATLVARSEDHDLAVLAIEADDLPTVELGDSRSLAAGEWVIALGHPWGVKGAITAGVIVGNTGDEFAELAQMTGEREWVVASLHMRPGHSGGVMVDSRGRVIGINTMINGPDVGVAIPIYPGSPAQTLADQALEWMSGQRKRSEPEQQPVASYV